MPYGQRRITKEEIAKLAVLPKLHFGAFSISTIPIGKDPDNPVLFNDTTNILQLSTTSSPEFSLITDISGFTWVKYSPLAERVITMTGTVTWQENNGTGGTAELKLWSSRTNDDGVTFTENAGSLRTTEIGNTDESSSTKSSFVFEWVPGEAIRWEGYNDGGGTLTFDTPIDTVNGGNIVEGFSFFWNIAEV